MKTAMSKRDNYPLFVHWYGALDWILTTVERFPRNARFTLGERLVQSGLTIVELIVEAIYRKQRAPLLHRINLELEKQRVLMRIAHDRRYISHRQYEFAAQALDKAGRMTGGWLKQSS